MNFLSRIRRVHMAIVILFFALILDLDTGVRCSGMWWSLGFLATKFTPNTISEQLAVDNGPAGATKRNLPLLREPPETLMNNQHGYLSRSNIALVAKVLDNSSDPSTAHTSIIPEDQHTRDMRSISAWCNLPGLSQGQKKLCVLYHDHMYGVGKGAQYGIHECQFQFRDQKWNCSVRHNDETVFGPILKIPSRETAFAHAINSAGVVHAISRFCRQGVLPTCGCSQNQKPTKVKGGNDWKWAGCGDNLKYGYRFATEFIDIREREKFRENRRDGAKTMATSASTTEPKGVGSESADGDGRVRGRMALNRNRNKYAKSLMNLHNNEAGRRAVHHTSQINCKCHGVSGSCSVKTCWLQLGPFRKIGHLLKAKYDGSTRVKLNRQGKLQVAVSSESSARDKRLVDSAVSQNYQHLGIKVPTALDLVYLKRSPDFCRLDPATGSSGTTSRVCAIRLDQTRPDQRYADIRDFGSFEAPGRVIRDDAGGTYSSLDSVPDLNDRTGGALSSDEETESGAVGSHSTLTRNLVSLKGGDLNDLMTFYLFSSSLQSDDGSLGAKSDEASTCRDLCCGRGHIKRTLVLQLRCDCKFQWCCHVKCSLCERNVTLFVCR